MFVQSSDLDGFVENVLKTQMKFIFVKDAIATLIGRKIIESADENILSTAINKQCEKVTGLKLQSGSPAYRKVSVDLFAANEC